MPPVLSNIVFTKTDTTIVATWDTDIAADSNLTAGGKAAVDNGVAAPVTVGHQCIVAGLSPSTLYSCVVTSGGVSSSPQNITTNAAHSSTPVTGVTFGSPTATSADGDIPYNFLSNDNIHYMMRDDAKTPPGGAGFNQQIDKITNEATLALQLVNGVSNYGAFATNNGSDGPGGSTLSNKGNGLFGMAGSLFWFTGRHYIVGTVRQQYYGNVIRSDDHGASWSNFNNPTTFNVNGIPAYPNSGSNSIAPFYFGNNSAWGWVAPVRYAADDGTLGYNTAGNGFDGGNAYVYFTINDGPNDGGDQLYLGRIPRIQLFNLDRASQQFWIGPTSPTAAQFVNDANWTSSTSGLTKIYNAPGKVGWQDMCFIPAINRYLLFTEYRPNKASTANTTWLILEGPTPAGPWSQVGARSNNPSGYYNFTILHRTAAANVLTDNIPLTVICSGDYNNATYYHPTYSTLTLSTTGGGGGGGTVAAFVQEAHNTTTQSGTSVALAYGSNVTNGNLLCVAFRYNGSGSPKISSITSTRTTGNWTIVYDQNDGGTPNIQGGWAYAFATSTGACTVTVNFSASVVGAYMAQTEHSGVNTFRAASTPAIGTTPSAIIGNNATATATDLQLGFSSLGAANAGSFVAAGGYTQRSTGANGTTPFVSIEDILSSAGGSVSSSFTYSISAVAWSTGVGLFYSLTGSSISGNAGTPGATVNYSGAASGSVTADGSGNYSIPNLANGTYTITPAKTGFTFSPTSSVQVMSGSNISGVDFTALSQPLPLQSVLASGTPTKLNGASTLTSAADMVFSFAPRKGGNFSVTFQAVGTVTALTASLQVSLDGTTWTDYIAAGSFISNGTPTKTIRPLIAGALYRVHATAVTGSMDIWAVSE